MIKPHLDRDADNSLHHPLAKAQNTLSFGSKVRLRKKEKNDKNKTK